jgi:hypothetical protein
MKTNWSIRSLVSGPLGGAGLDAFANDPNAPDRLFGLNTAQFVKRPLHSGLDLCYRRLYDWENDVL